VPPLQDLCQDSEKKLRRSARLSRALGADLAQDGATYLFNKKHRQSANDRSTSIRAIRSLATNVRSGQAEERARIFSPLVATMMAALELVLWPGATGRLSSRSDGNFRSGAVR
jgi:hypothetical protein